MPNFCDHSSFVLISISPDCHLLDTVIDHLIRGMIYGLKNKGRIQQSTFSDRISSFSKTGILHPLCSFLYILQISSAEYFLDGGWSGRAGRESKMVNCMSAMLESVGLFCTTPQTYPPRKMIGKHQCKHFTTCDKRNFGHS